MLHLCTIMIQYKTCPCKLNCAPLYLSDDLLMMMCKSLVQVPSSQLSWSLQKVTIFFVISYVKLITGNLHYTFYTGFSLYIADRQTDKLYVLLNKILLIINYVPRTNIYILMETYLNKRAQKEESMHLRLGNRHSTILAGAYCFVFSYIVFGWSHDI